jgi:hypothetical protein
MTDADTNGTPEDGGLIQPRDDGQLHFAEGTEGWTFPVSAPDSVTPLSEDEPEGTIPPSPLYAMKARAHGGLHLFGHPHRIRAVSGSGDAAVYAIDDGSRHCMIGRRVGATADGCTYSLVARVPLAVWQSLEAGEIDGRQAFSVSEEAGLSGTVEDGGLSEVFDVAWYDSPAAIPDGYLPPAPFAAFAEPLPTADR